MQSWLPFMPDKASTFADSVDGLFFYLVGLTAFFTLLITITLVFFVIKYRRRSQTEVPRPVAGSLKLETIWTVVPFLHLRLGHEGLFRSVPHAQGRDGDLRSGQAVDVEDSAPDGAARD
ncbi:MAG: hypothetical protein M3362_16905 [Acidobacteriota bacterium]|nr:hypothetical protein [Acidobacteriota bacterium]